MSPLTPNAVPIIREAALSEAEQTVYTCAQLPDTRYKSKSVSNSPV
jgi:hypothetical protein